jgi:tetratricopeptide (TPR) repeat protein
MSRAHPPDDAAGRWQRIKQLFGDALERPAGERGAWLAAAAGADDDPGLLAEVARLLAAHEAADERLDQGAAAMAPGAWEELQTAVAGRRIGPYRILSELGRGGMGAVYLAVRDEAGFEQRVAVKLIKRGMDTDGIVRRFLRERRILAGLAHPHIARLFDGGSTADGRPYFVLEYVAGEPVTRYAAERGLGIEARLALFLKVCSAVQHAHQRLIVHRDLKPANILVGADGEPKLLDFGIAKLLDPGESEGAPELTELHQRPMTPDYASPEQLDGGAVTTATDVHGLGTLLYELLVGKSPAAVERQLGAGWAERPASQAARVLTGGGAGSAEGRRLARRLRGDLDTVIATAREPLSARRYGTAAGLAEDVERHLTHRPVAARRPTVLYRLGRAVLRHKLAALFMVSLLAFAATAAWQAWEIDRQRARSEALSGFLKGLFQGADPERTRGNTLTVRELLDQGARRLVRQPAGDPGWQADALATVGEVYANLGLYDDADRVLRRALALRSRQAGRPAERDAATLLTLLGHVAWERGDGTAARGLYERAIASRRRLLGPHALPLAEDLNGLGLVSAEAGDEKRAAACFAAAARIARRAGDAGRKALADALDNQGWLARRRGDLPLAQARFEESLALSRQVVGDDHPETMKVRSNLAVLRFQRGDLAGAESGYREILATRRHLLGPDHPDVARTLNNLGTVQEKRGELPAAEGSFREAVAMCRRLRPEPELIAALALDGLGAVARRQGDLAAAERAFDESCELFRRHPGEDPQGLADAFRLRAMVQRERGEAAGAARGLRQGIELLSGVGGTEVQAAKALRLLAEIERAAGHPGAATEAERRSAALAEKGRETGRSGA